MHVCMTPMKYHPIHQVHIRNYVPTTSIYMIHIQPCNYKVVQFSHKAVQSCPSLVTVSIPSLLQPSDNQLTRLCDNLVNKLVTTKNTHIFSIWVSIGAILPISIGAIVYLLAYCI